MFDVQLVRPDMPNEVKGSKWSGYPTISSFVLVILIMVLGFALYSKAQNDKYEVLKRDVADLRNEIKTERAVEAERNNQAIVRADQLMRKLDVNAITTTRCYDKLDTILKGMMADGAKSK